MKTILFTSVMLLYVNVLGQNDEKNEALLFNRFTHLPFYLPRVIPSNAECDSWALACPAETSSEVNFNMKYSITKNSLFVKKIHRKGNKMTSVEKNICKEPIQISVTYNVKNSTLQLGFEIFYELDQVKYFHENNLEGYKSIEKVSAALKTISNSKTKFAAERVTGVLKNSINNGIEELWIDEDQRLGFIWVNLVQFKFDFSKKIVKQATYNIGPNSKWPVLGEQCENYRLGSELYEGVDVNSLYSWNKRAEFSESKNPSHKCQSNDKCFKKILILPVDQFRSGSSVPLCSNMLTIPIWQDSNSKPIEYFVKKVDQYLYLLFRTVGTPLRIIAGTSGEYEFVTKNGWSKSKSTIYLDPYKKKIPIPKIIYKIVEYRLKNCKLEEQLCWYSTIIVIHNDPFFDSYDENSRLCSDSYIKYSYWQEMREDEFGNEHDFIYICPRDEDIEMRLTGERARRLPQENKIINLKAFPVTVDGIQISYVRIEHIIHWKIYRFEKKGEDLELETSKMIEWDRENDSGTGDAESWRANADTDEEIDPREVLLNPETRYQAVDRLLENN